MSTINIEELLHLVCPHEILWDHRLAAYKNTRVTDPLWPNIAAQLNCDALQAKKRFKNIKDQYRKAKNNYLPSGSAGGNNKSWPYYDLCAFMDRVMPAAATEDNLGSAVTASISNAPSTSRAPPPAPRPHSANVEMSVFGDGDGDEMLSDEAEERRRGNETPKPLPTPRCQKKKNRAANVDSVIAIENKKIRLLETHLKASQEKNTPPATDPDTQFFMSMLPYFKELQPLEKLRTMREIQDVILRAYETRATPATTFEYIEVVQQE